MNQRKPQFLRFIHVHKSQNMFEGPSCHMPPTPQVTLSTSWSLLYRLMPDTGTGTYRTAHTQKDEPRRAPKIYKKRWNFYKVRHIFAISTYTWSVPTRSVKVGRGAVHTGTVPFVGERACNACMPSVSYPTDRLHQTTCPIMHSFLASDKLHHLSFSPQPFTSSK